MNATVADSTLFIEELEECNHAVGKRLELRSSEHVASIAVRVAQRIHQCAQLIAYSSGRCRLLELPPEIRDQIWSFAVTEWSPTKLNNSSTAISNTLMLHKASIRIDRLNTPPPPAVTRTCRQIRSETLHLYYSENIFECWRPLPWLSDWSRSTFVAWLTSLGPERRGWIDKICLLYKHHDELAYDIEEPLADYGILVRPGVISAKQELSELEKCHEEMGLPVHFGRKKRRN